MKISWNIKVILGVFTIVAGVLLLGFDSVETSVGLSVLNAGAIITLASYAYSRRKERIAHDERTQRLGALAASYSWMFTYLLLALSVWVLEFAPITLSVQAFLGLVLAEMSITLLISKWWLSRKEF